MASSATPDSALLPEPEDDDADTTDLIILRIRFISASVHVDVADVGKVVVDELGTDGCGWDCSLSNPRQQRPCRSMA